MIFLVSISYDGNGFFGWAKQKNKFTIQGHIEEKLSFLFKFKINIIGSSRTDKFVHAEDQNFSFHVPFNIGENDVLNILKRNLSEKILVKKVRIVDNSFHPIRNVIFKEYHYIVNLGKFNLFENSYCLQYCSPINQKKFNDILGIFIGYNDFFNFSFCRFKERKEKNTFRKINIFDTFFKGEKMIIRIISKGFLRYQIRAMIGESIKCYEGKLDIDELKKKLSFFSNSLLKYKFLAPPNALYLKKIFFSKIAKKI